MARKKRKAYFIFTTPEEQQASDEMAMAVQNMFNVLASNYNIPAEKVLRFYMLFTKAPGEIISMMNALEGGNMNLMHLGQQFNSLKTKLKNG